MGIVILTIDRVWTQCREDTQCPGDQICLVEPQSSNFKFEAKSYCGCPEGFVLWKWRCFRSAYQIHDPCIVSVQCQEGQVCHPLSNVCSCPFGISNCTKTMTATENPTTVTSKIMDSIHAKHHEHIIAAVNKTIHENLNKSRNAGDFYHKGQNEGWTDEQILTLVYIAIGFLVIICISIISAIYMRSISEKKRSAAAIKSLLDLMAENRSLQSVYTMDGLYATSNHYESPPERSEKAVQNDQDHPAMETSSTDSYPNCNRCVDNLDGKNVDHNDLPPVIQANASNLDIYEGRIKLDPIEEIEQQPKLPSPHLSAPVLPRIRPRPVLALKVEDQPTTNTLAAITHNLNNMKTMVTTAASFPDDDDEINPIQLQFKTNDI